MIAPGHQTSVIVKRQVPIRFQDKAKSWLGGLPMMPTLTKWPRDADGAPLHFVAQISCDDLPARLWNGLGPRKGWLLLFVETLKLEDEASGGTVQVIHTKRLGSEREPPKDAPTVRHAMSDYIDYAQPNIRPGVPKLWRKWPVDLVVQDYEPVGEDGPPHIPAPELYDAPVSETGIARGAFDIDRPLTWRGAFYVIEGLRRDLDPDNFKRKFEGVGGLIEPPESDQVAFNAALKQRVEDTPACADRDVGWGPRVSAVTDALKAELRAERRSGWMMRAFTALDAAKRRLETWRDTHQQEIDAGINTLSAEKLTDLRARVGYQIESLEKLEEDREYLNSLCATYPGQAGEEAFNAEIKALGEAHLAWGAQLAAAVRSAQEQILSQDLDVPIAADDWDRIASAFTQTTSTFWNKTHGNRVLTKVERSLTFQKHLDMAVREDLLDLYTRSQQAASSIPHAQCKDLEERARYIENCLPHRIGGQANPVQGEADPSRDPSRALLFQIASDSPMGWMWGDLGALYVAMAPNDLRRGRFDRVEAWIEGH